MMLTLLGQAVNTATTADNSTYLLWGILLFVAAMGLLCLELFIPSGGLIGLLCGVAAVGSVVAFFQYDSGWGVASIGIYILLIPIGLVFFFKYLFWFNTKNQSF